MTNKYFNIPVKIALFCAIFFVTSAISVHAEDTRTPEVRTFRSYDHKQDKAFLAYDQAFQGGASVAVGDLGGDGIDEIITGAGANGGPHVRIFRQDGSFVTGFFAYNFDYRKGVRVATGDLNGDGVDEIITGTAPGGGPFVRVFNGQGEPQFTNGFYAFAPEYHGGIHVAAGDVDGDGADDIIVGVGQGATAHVRVFNRFGQVMSGYEFFPFSENLQGGVSVTAANVDGGPEDEIIMGVAAFGKSYVKVYKTNSAQTVLGEWMVFADDFYGGVKVAAGDVDHDGVDEVVVGVGSDGTSHVRFFEAYGQEIAGSFFAYEESFKGGVNVVTADFNKDGNSEIITAPNRMTANGGDKYYKYIEIDISEQRLYAYEGGGLARSFLISSGLPGAFETPRGEFTISEKLLYHDYRWNYGPGSPYNYNLPNVKYNLRFNGHLFIHYAYWHNDFGRKKSHGCVNVNLENSEWIYNWANIGDKVIVHD